MEKPSASAPHLKPEKVAGYITWATSLLFAGHAWVWIFWDGPLREFLWDQALFEPILTGWFDMAWADFVTDLRITAQIQNVSVAGGLVLLLCAAAVHLGDRFRKPVFALLVLGWLLLSLQGVVWIRNGYPAWGVALEYMAQWSCPLLWLLLRAGRKFRGLSFQWLRLAVAATFIGHGLYASGILPLPGHFLDMSMNSLRISQAQAVLFLRVAGGLDFLAAAGLFMPRPLNRWAAGYMVFWGLSTSLARVAGHWAISDAQMLWGYWLFQSVLRAPHFLLPMALWSLFRAGFTQPGFQPSAPDPGQGVSAVE